MKYIRTLGAAVALAACFTAVAVAAVVHGAQWSATYIAAYNPMFGGGGVPYSGEMKLTFNHGIINGTYTSTSVRPDPLRGRINLVTGTVQHGNINLAVGGGIGFTVRGTLAQDGTISGTATKSGQFYRFLAKVKSSP